MVGRSVTRSLGPSVSAISYASDRKEASSRAYENSLFFPIANETLFFPLLCDWNYAAPTHKKSLASIFVSPSFFLRSEYTSSIIATVASSCHSKNDRRVFHRLSRDQRSSFVGRHHSTGDSRTAVSPVITVHIALLKTAIGSSVAFYSCISIWILAMRL